MAEVVVGYVLRKLLNMTSKETELLGGVGEKVELVQGELTKIQHCLADAYSKRNRDERVKNWLNEVCDETYRIEDALDKLFLAQVEENRQKDPSFLQKLNMLWTNPLDSVRHKVGKELDDIQNKLKDISSSRVHHGIIPLKEMGKREAIKLPFSRSVNEEVDETKVIGLQDDKNNILKLLCAEEKPPRRTVITIVGMGGLGKTTLANMVYISAKEKFDYDIMLSISREFSLTDLLKKMLRQPKDSVTENQDTDDLISKLKIYLSNSRYLIILDDVWSIDLWDQLKDALPDNNNGSRILMTSRSIHVAMSADPEMKPYELRFLNEKESKDLLETALRSQQPVQDYPSDLLEVAMPLLKRCQGLPLALIVLGGILSTKERSYPAWKKVSQTFDWHSDGNEWMQVLAMSYDDMPYYLKACFLYLASFPEYYEISAKRLIRMWAAEGFILQGKSKTIEKAAEDCLEELIQRSLVQVSSRSIYGSTKYLQVHPLLHDLAVHKARQENFVTVFSQASDVFQLNTGIRRASFQSCSPQFTKHVGPRTRSLLWFFVDLPKFSNFDLLRIVELVGVTNYTDKLVRGLDKLIHLQYLGFRNCTILISSCSFQHIKNLETLDVRGTRAELPNTLWTIHTLRHVLFDDALGGPSLDGPLSTADLSNLQTMWWVSPLRTWDTECPRLNNLCKLGVSNFFENWITVTNLLLGLSSLVSLGIKGTSLPVEIVYPDALPNYQNLQSLYLQGKWSPTVTLEASLFPQQLLKLTLIESRFGNNPMPELGELKSLKKLHLGKNVLNYSGPTDCREGFPVLQYLEVTDYLDSMKVHKGVMPKLTYILARCVTNLVLPDEILHARAS